MTVEITPENNGVKVKYIADNGGEATAIVLGESASSVRDRSSEIVAIHNLDAKAQEAGQ